MGEAVPNHWIELFNASKQVIAWLDALGPAISATSTPAVKRLQAAIAETERQVVDTPTDKDPELHPLESCKQSGVTVVPANFIFITGPTTIAKAEE